MKKLAVLISTSLMFASAPSFSEVYVGAKVGKSWLDDSCTSSVCDDEDSTVGTFLGYQMWDFLSLEAGYDYLGEFQNGSMKDDISAITLAPKANLALTDDISLYGKLGGAYVDYGSKNDWSYLGAVGLEFDSHQNVLVRLEYQTLTDMNNDVVRAAGNSATLGVVYTFGGASQAEPAPVVEPEVMVVEQPEPEPEPEPTWVDKTYQTTTLGESYFALNSTELKPESAPVLDKLVDFLAEYPESEVVIIGHTDSTGSEQYNQMISEKRAQSVSDALQQRGIEQQRISVEGRGELEPKASNKTREGRKQNRRVEIIIPSFDYQIQQ